MEAHTVQEGDCILSIAQRHGFLWETIWNYPDNGELKALRQDPNVLLPGDVVRLPEKGTKEESRPTNAHHRFELDANLAKFKIRILIGDKPYHDAPYQLRLPGGDIRTGNLDAGGFFTEEIPASVAEGQLVVGPPNNQITWNLQFGGLDPLTTPSGVEQRLVELGFDGQANLKERIKAFQEKHHLDDTGEMDVKTQSLLEQEFGQ